MKKLYESLWTRKQLAEYLQVSQKTVERLEQRGFLPRIELPGGTIRYKPSSVIKCIDRMEKFRPSVNPDCMIAFGGDGSALRDTYIER